MAKYVYERWDYDTNIDFVVTDTNPNKLNELYKNGEVNLAVGVIERKQAKAGKYYISYMDATDLEWNLTYSKIYKYFGESFLRSSTSSYRKSAFQDTLHPTVLIEEIIAEEGTYPDNGIQGDYWYIKTRKVFPDLHIKVNGELRKVQSAWVKVGSVLKEVKDIYVKKDGQLKKGI